LLNFVERKWRFAHAVFGDGLLSVTGESSVEIVRVAMLITVNLPIVQVIIIAGRRKP
jgi:hypothetical protein